MKWFHGFYICYTLKFGLASSSICVTQSACMFWSILIARFTWDNVHIYTLCAQPVLIAKNHFLERHLVAKNLQICTYICFWCTYIQVYGTKNTLCGTKRNTCSISKTREQQVAQMWTDAIRKSGIPLVMQCCTKHEKLHISKQWQK